MRAAPRQWRRPASAWAATILWAAAALGGTGWPPEGERREGEDAGGLSLKEAVAVALANNHDLKLAELAADRAERESDRVRSRFLPLISAAAAYDLRDREKEVGFGPQRVSVAEKEFMRAELTARMTVWDFGRTLGAYRGAEGAAEAVRYALQRVRQEVIYRTCVAYCRVLTTCRLLEAADAAVRSARAHLADAEVLLRNGVVTERDVLRARANLEEQRRRQIEARNAKRLAEMSFNHVLGREVSRPVRLREEAGGLPADHGGSATGALKVAVLNRPEFRQMAALLEAAEGRRIAARGQFLPRIYVAGSLTHLDDRYQVHRTEALAEVGLQYDLFSGGRHLAELRIAGLEVDRALEQADKVADAVALQVRRALLAAETAAASLAAASSTLAFAEENRRLVRSQYRQGAASCTDVMDAEMLWLRAQADYWRARHDRQVAGARILYALGTIDAVLAKEEEQ